MPDPRRVGVVVVTHESEAVLPGLAETLDEGLAGLDWEMVLVDNGSADRTVAVARELFPRATIEAASTNRGFAAGVNLASVRVAESSDLLLVNPDARLQPGCGLAMVRRLDRELDDRPGVRVGIVAPRLVDGAGAQLPALRMEPTARRVLAETVLGTVRAGQLGLGEAVLASRAYREATVADWATGAVLAVSARCRAACGPWDESFFLYSEDCEYALRAAGRGFATQLAPEALAVHLGGASRSDTRLWTLLALNKLRLYRRRHGAALGAAFRIAALLRELRWAILGNGPSWAAAAAIVLRDDRRQGPRI